MRISYKIDSSLWASLSFTRWLQLASLGMVNFYVVFVSALSLSYMSKSDSSTTIAKVQGSLVLIQAIVSEIFSNLIYMHILIALPTRLTLIPLFLSVVAFIVRVSIAGFTENKAKLGVDLVGYEATSILMIFTIISWMLLTEIDFEISFDRPIAAYGHLKELIEKIPTILSRPPSDSESQNSILGRSSDTSSYNPSVARSSSLASTSSSLPSYRSDDLPAYNNRASALAPLYEGSELNILEQVAVREIKGKKRQEHITVDLPQSLNANSRNNSSSRSCVIQ